MDGQGSPIQKQALSIWPQVALLGMDFGVWAYIIQARSLPLAVIRSSEQGSNNRVYSSDLHCSG